MDLPSAPPRAGGGGALDDRQWRAALLALRDEFAATSPDPPSAAALLRRLVLGYPAADLAAATALLPRQEVAADVALLAETASACGDDGDVLFGVCHLVHEIFTRGNFVMTSSYWSAVLNFLQTAVERLLHCLSCKSMQNTKEASSVLSECLQILRLIVKSHGRSLRLLESIKLVKILLLISLCLQSEIFSLPPSSKACTAVYEVGSRNMNCLYSSLWDIYISAFAMLEDDLCRVGTTISKELWQSTVEVLRKVLEHLTGKNIFMENNIMSRLYTTILRCLHLVLSDPKDNLSVHVAGFVAILQAFFMYGLRSSASAAAIDVAESKLELKLKMSNGSGNGRYRPPHLRRKEQTQEESVDVHTSDCESSRCELSSSDSDLSDGDVNAKTFDRFRSSKTRIVAIMCIQDLSRADPKLLTSLWPLFLPENDVLQLRKCQPTLMACLLFDPITKVRAEAASTISLLLDGQALVLLQVAEYKEALKLGSFTTLSFSLGQILMHLHKGILYSFQRESHTGLLVGLLKVLASLISATPYSRMPDDLLSSLVAFMCHKILGSRVLKNENCSTMVGFLGCLGAAFSKSPPSVGVLKLLEENSPQGALHEQDFSPRDVLLHCIDTELALTIRCEAFLTLGAMVHSYPTLAPTIWKQVSACVFDLLSLGKLDSEIRDSKLGSFKDEVDKGASSTFERCLMNSVKAVDQCLRAVSGYKGADDHIEGRLLDMPDILDSARTTRISSAPSFELNLYDTKSPLDGSVGIFHWSEAIEKLLPRALHHTSPQVRVAAVTCYAGLTSTVFFALSVDERQFVITSILSISKHDVAPSVRSAACRAIGVVSCFPEVFLNFKVLNDFIHAIEFNTHNSSVPVRITAAWALANICASLRHRVSNLPMKSCADLPQSTISILVETALRLSKDSDKVKSNAVRALGNISRFMRFVGPIDKEKSSFCGDPVWLERMVQSFVSCVTTGNVKVQWNVCHALSNLFMNDTIDLAVVAWAQNVFSILLLLLRDSTNYKIRIHAAVALAVPTSRRDYGSSFSDIIQGLIHVLESLGGSTSPSNFKYRASLEKQLAYTTLHVLSVVTYNDDHGLKQFLVKKSLFLEEWIRLLCASLNNLEDQSTGSASSTAEQQVEGVAVYVPKKAMLLAAVESLSEVYKSCNNQTLIRKFAVLASNLS